MISKISIENFKRLDKTEIDLSSSVVFAGPNNSGKTSALQAIALWELGMRKWAENRKKTKAKQRTGVTINRKDILAVPVPSAKQLWKNLHVREGTFVKGKSKTKNIVIKISAEGFTDGKTWELGFEYDFANQESIYCRILKDEKTGEPKDFPEEALKEKIGFLPPMSGLATEEHMLQPGSIQSLIGEGRTAEVLRNLCLRIWNEKKDKWVELTDIIKRLFAVELEPPVYYQATGKITMLYKEDTGIKMDLSNAGRGFHQILLLFSYMFAGENSILLLDEPDAHLEIIRQEEIYNQLSEIIKKENAQLIIATHSEKVLNEAAGKDTIVAFLGNPHIVNDKSQLVKSLTKFGFEEYLLAENKRRIIYLEGSTDLAILKAFAIILQHPVENFLNNPFVKYVTNRPSDAREHFYALLESVPTLKGIAIFDHLNIELDKTGKLKELMWSRNEIENYLPMPAVITRYVKQPPADLFHQQDINVMNTIINDLVPPIALKNSDDSWWIETKMSDFIERVFKMYSNRVKRPLQVYKGRYYELALLSKPEEIKNEVKEKLDAIFKVLGQ
ncbi:MAG: AAA family ATPase [Elusimicrobia bacterium HGW-Elusimicrobia-2]|nr:MAG: AAA family ATPase [Elusimicrobia bacterium HGW-Elusimicrobia-2]